MSHPEATASPGVSSSSPLVINGVTVAFGGLTAVSDVSLEVRAGERVGLIGPNGAGKTTLVNTISGEIQPRAGTVRIDGVDVSSHRPFQRFRAGLARTFQVAHPFPALGVLDAVMLGPLAKGMSRTEAQTVALEALAAIGRGRHSGRTMSELNPTEAKLVELARVIASNPAVVMLDELLAGSLPSERHAILELLTEVSGEKRWATILIEHLIPDVRSFCERVVVLDQGRIIADGPTDAVLEDPGVLKAYLGNAPTETIRAAEEVMADEH